MYSMFDELVQKILKNSQEEMIKLNHKYIGTEHLLLSILMNPNLEITKILNKKGIDYDTFKNKVIELKGIGKEETKYYIYTPLLRSIIEEAEIICRNDNRDIVTFDDLTNSFLKENEGIAIRVLIALGINIETLLADNPIKKSKKTSKKKLIVEEYGYNMNLMAQNGEIDPVIGRDKEVRRIIEILCRKNKCNPLLVGAAGVGKTAIVEELAKKIVKGDVPNNLKDKKIISVSMAGLVSGTKYRGEFEDRITKMLFEIENSNDVILFIDEIHTLVGAGGADGAIDASNVLKPYLARGKIKLIGATTVDEYKKSIENDRALERRFQVVEINQPNKKETVEILKNIKQIYEKYHKVEIDNNILEKIVELSEKYLCYRNQPDKSIDLLDEACSRTSLMETRKAVELREMKEKIRNLVDEKNKYVINKNIKKASELRKIELEMISKYNRQKILENHNNVKRKVKLSTIMEVINSKISVPVNNCFSNQVVKSLKKHIFGQDKTVEELANEIFLIKSGIKLDKKPKSYLFVGPQGVGKTYVATSLSKYIYNNDYFIRLDMNDFTEDNSIARIVGSPPGYIGFENKHTLLDEIKRKPNAIIILDNINKASKNVLNIFKQIIDMGEIKNSNNEIIRFDNNIIIMITNEGFNKANIGFVEEKQSCIENHSVAMEMCNMVDKAFFFNYLDEKCIKKIINDNEKKYLNKLNISKRHVLTNNNVNMIINNSNYNIIGAKKIEKLVFDFIVKKVIKEKFNKSVNKTMETV